MMRKVTKIGNHIRQKLKMKKITFCMLIHIVVLTAIDATAHTIRHQKHRRDKEMRYGNISTVGASENYDENYQSNPPQTTTDDTLPPFAYMTISEINLDTNSVPAKRFIELHLETNPHRTPPPFQNQLQGWRLVFVKGATMELFMSIDLSSQIFDYTGSKIVVGDNLVPGVHIKFQHDKTEACLDECLVDLDTSPFAIILLVSMNSLTHEIFSLPKQGGKYKSVSILDDKVKQQMILKYAWDVAVVGRSVPTNQCDFFTSLFPTRAFKSDFKYLLRDRDSPTSSIIDYSLNYCCRDFVPFSPDCYKLGHPSPGFENDCTGKRFIIEMEMNKIQLSRMSQFFVDVNSPLCKADFPGVPSYRYATIHDHDYAAAVARVMQTSDSCEKADQYLEIDPSKQDAHHRLLAVQLDENTTDDPKEYIDAFDLESFRRCQRHFSNPNDLLGATITSWLKVNPRNCRITCRMCSLFLESGWHPDKKNKWQIHGEGYLSKQKSKNQAMVEDHLGDDLHIEASLFYTSLKSATTRSEQLHVEFQQRSKEIARLQPTMNEIKLAYIELRARVSFRSHRLFMDGVSKLNVNVGFKHRTADALKQICSTLSNSFHLKLLKSLIKSNQFFSLICDGTTNRSVPYLVCLIQSLEENAPIVYFWRMFVITTGESGYNMVEDLKVHVSEDDDEVPGFKKFFQERMIAFVSDSASNMVGKYRSFFAFLQKYLGKDIALVKCGAHKLQRAILHGIDFPTDNATSASQNTDRERYFKSFAKINNQFYSFYMSRGSKRFQEFVELAEELDLHAYRINYFFDVRWAASHKRCMETLYNNYDALFADLSRIKLDGTYDDSGKNKAVELHKHLTDKTFAVVMSEFVDMLTVFKTMSERFQSKGGIMAGNVEIIRDGYQDLEFLQLHPGSFLQNFLSECACDGVCVKGSCTLEQYDDCSEVSRNSEHKLQFRADGSHTIALSAFRNQLYENLLHQLLEYFNTTTLEAFEIFNPHYFQDRCQLPNSDAIQSPDIDDLYVEFQPIVRNTENVAASVRLETICEFYSIGDCETISIEWPAFLSKITKDTATMKLRDRDPARFWPLILNRKDIEIPGSVRDLITRVLSTSFTSADAERAFSMVSNIKTPDRSSLSPKTLESLVRISFNGPDILSEDSAFEYTKDFVKVSSRVDDPSKGGGRPAKPEAYKSYFSKSRIF